MGRGDRESHRDHLNVKCHPFPSLNGGSSISMSLTLAPADGSLRISQGLGDTRSQGCHGNLDWRVTFHRFIFPWEIYFWKATDSTAAVPTSFKRNALKYIWPLLILAAAPLVCLSSKRADKSPWI